MAAEHGQRQEDDVRTGTTKCIKDYTNRCTTDHALDPSPAAPDSSPAAPDTSPAAPDTSLAALDTSPAAPDSSPAAPDTSPAAPDTSLAAPDTSLAAPDTSPAAPDSSPAAPDTSPAAPDSSPAAPDTSPAAPDTSLAAPDSSLAAPGPFLEPSPAAFGEKTEIHRLVLGEDVAGEDGKKAGGNAGTRCSGGCVDAGGNEAAGDGVECRAGGGWRRVVRSLALSLLLAACFVYLTLALMWSFQRALPVLCLTLLTVWNFTWTHLSAIHPMRRFRQRMTQAVGSLTSRWLQRRPVRLGCYGMACAAMLTYCVVTNTGRPQNLLPVGGVLLLLAFSVLISHDRRNVCLRPVVWGLAGQMVLGVLVLKTQAGAATFRWLGHQVEIFLAYVTAGVTFVFGDKYQDFYFAFRLMPTVLFVSSVMSILYYIGLMHTVVKVISMVMKVSMGTTAPETVSTAASIFLGQPEASFTIRPYLSTMSNSELHAIMTAGFASVSADVFGLFVDYGVSSAHILTAVLMSAPAGLAVSKIVCPMPPACSGQTPPHRQHTTSLSHDDLDQDVPQNIIDAAGRGAQEAVNIILAVGATLIAFLSILAFLNATVAYLGSLVHIQDLTIELALSYPLMPLAYVMGVPWGECRVVGEVIALKTVLNELVGYERLGHYIHSHTLSKRSQVIATYALCGFSNPTTVGVTLGGLSALVPSRRRDLAKLVISAWVSGCVACFLTACFAGVLFEDDSLPDLNTTTSSQIYL